MLKAAWSRRVMSHLLQREAEIEAARAAVLARRSEAAWCYDAIQGGPRH